VSWKIGTEIEIGVRRDVRTREQEGEGGVVFIAYLISVML
jgi:hypothetical protein